MENISSVKSVKILNSKNVFVLKWGGKNKLIGIREWLYEDSTVFLERKKKKFDSISLKKSKGSSKYRGVHKTKNGKWITQIAYNGTRYHVGSYNNEVEAALSYNDALVKFGKSLNYKNIIE